jgi:hypothetical protein
MSTRYKDGSHYENHQRAAELEDIGAHAHRVGEQQGEGDHLTGHEQNRQADEHAREVYETSPTATVGHGIVAFGHAETAALAHRLWLERGSPEGSADEDWHNAVRILKSRSFGH